MPNWSDENGRYWWERPGHWATEIPHPPLITEKRCKCPFCKHSHKNKQEKQTGKTNARKTNKTKI
jgi:hypothetical protein